MNARSDDMLQVGLIGVGKWGKNIARTIREEVPGMRIHRAGSNNPNAPEIVGKECIIHGDWRELLSCGDLDGILIAVPARLHREIAGAVIDAGIPLFMEKPMALNISDAEALYELGRAAGAIAHVDHVDLHNPAVAEMMKVMSDRGPATRIIARVGSFYDRRPDIAPLWEYSPHFIAVSTVLAGGMPDAISAKNLPIETDPRDDSTREIIALEYHFPGGTECLLEVGNGMKLKTRRLTACFGEAAVKFDDQSTHKLTIRHGEGDEHVVDIDPTLPLTLAIRSFGSAIRRGNADFDGLEMGVNVVKILEAATRAQASGERIRIQ